MSDTAVVRPEGEIFDQIARDLKVELLDLTSAHPTVVVDLARVTFFASEGVTAVVVALREAARRGHRLYVDVARGTLPHRVLEISGVPFRLVEPG